MNETLVRFGNSSVSLDRRGRASQVQLLDLLARLDHALRVADRDMLEAPLRPAAVSAPVPSGPPEGKSGEVTDALPMASVAVSPAMIVG